MMAHLLKDLTNEIYDADPYPFNGEKSTTYPLIMGVIISLIPRLVPKILPAFLKSEKQRKKFDDEAYEREIEELFVQKFQENLQMFENLVLKWRDNPINFSDLGLSADNPFAKEDLFVGSDVSKFQDQLLTGIRYLSYRVDRTQRKDDRITKIADLVWNVMSVAFETINGYLTGY